MDMRDRLMGKVVINHESGCWEWTAATSYGYGVIRVNRHTVGAHRVSYETFHGSIPDNLTIDHLCRNRRCINPEHLEPVTQTVNTLRGTSPHAVNSRKTHCPQGHPYDEANTYYTRRPEGGLGRHCKICNRERAKQHRMQTKTHCLRGHRFSASNTYYGTDGRRYCWKCRDEQLSGVLHSPANEKSARVNVTHLCGHRQRHTVHGATPDAKSATITELTFLLCDECAPARYDPHGHIFD